MDTNTYARISLDTLVRNYKAIKTLAAPKEVISVIKANAYGHGAVECAEALQKAGARIFAVSSIDEALELREAGINASILVLGYIEPARAIEAVANELSVVIFERGFAGEMDRAASKLGKMAKLELKVDTGMNRLGFKSGGIEAIKEISELGNCSLEGVFSHFASADDKAASSNDEQYRLFDSFITQVKSLGINPGYVHIDNSAGLINFSHSCVNAVRCGILLYGLPPSPGIELSVPVKPALGFYSKIAHIFNVKKGEGISYSHSYIASSDMKVATISAGYADGYVRAYSNKAEVFIKGQRAKSVGNICMDMFMADITGLKDIQVGDEVELFGPNISAWELSAHSGSIAYEVLCLISKRVRRVYE
ncbi:MAG: alanine racemase [Eubacteriaceae bacterium]|nr:alanine racemase [Eubacteriaceae bacterium]